jgi:pyruvate dehydrogenase E1 component alpha subunit
MLKMRYFEEIISEIYKEGLIRTPVHLGIGQEATSAGILVNKTPADSVFSHHRCHNHFIGSGGSLNALAAELFGKRDGCSGGRGGSVHLVAREVGFLGTSAILGESVALGVGAAFGKKQLRKSGLSIVFFGDAALEEGIFWESLNFAALHSLPVVFVCENNLYSNESSLQKRLPNGSKFTDRVKSFGVDALQIDGNDSVQISNLSEKILSDIRVNPRPIFIECETYRWKEHVGPFFDYEQERSYRSKDELQNWMSKCPINKLEKHLVENDLVMAEELISIRTRVKSECTQAIEFAENSQFPELNSSHVNLYYED